MADKTRSFGIFEHGETQHDHGAPRGQVVCRQVDIRKGVADNHETEQGLPVPASYVEQRRFCVLKSSIEVSVSLRTTPGFRSCKTKLMPRSGRDGSIAMTK